MNNKSLKLKIALLSVYLITASLNAITANIPEMAKTFSNVPLYGIELIATIPSLFQMIGVLLGKGIASKIGYKKAVVFGLLLCAVGGSIPFFIQNFYLIFVTRCVFGFGCGLITAVMLTLIIYFFTDDTRSQMIGLTGSVGGLGSALSSFFAGRLLAYGWSASFAVYFIGFAVMLLVLLAVPNVRNISSTSKTENTKKVPAKRFINLIALTVVTFLSTLFATFFIIKVSTLFTSTRLGNAQDGSLAITFISLGSLLSGAMYGKIYAKMKDYSLMLFYVVSAFGLFCGGLFSSRFMIYVGAFLIGWGLIAFTPYFQERASRDFADLGETGTSFILIAQALGAFAAPYLGTLLNAFTNSLPVQYDIVGIFFLILALGAFVTALSTSHSPRLSRKMAENAAE